MESKLADRSKISSKPPTSKIKETVRVSATKSHSKQQMLLSISSMCLSLRSSKINEASVASELDYNNENASLESLDASLQSKNKPAQFEETNRMKAGPSLRENFTNLEVERNINTFGKLTMDDKGY